MNNFDNLRQLQCRGTPLKIRKVGFPLENDIFTKTQPLNINPSFRQPKINFQFCRPLEEIQLENFSVRTHSRLSPIRNQLESVLHKRNIEKSLLQNQKELLVRLGLAKPIADQTQQLIPKKPFLILAKGMKIHNRTPMTRTSRELNSTHYQRQITCKTFYGQKDNNLSQQKWIEHQAELQTKKKCNSLFQSKNKISDDRFTSPYHIRRKTPIQTPKLIDFQIKKQPKKIQVNSDYQNIEDILNGQLNGYHDEYNQDPAQEFDLQNYLIDQRHIQIFQEMN